jgi:hypothetical protein
MSGIKSFTRKLKTKLGAGTLESHDDADRVLENRVEEDNHRTDGEVNGTKTKNEGRSEPEEQNHESGGSSEDTRNLSCDLGARFGYSVLSYSPLLIRWKKEPVPHACDGGRGVDIPDMVECVLKDGEWRVCYSDGADSEVIDSAEDRREALKTVCWVMENGVDEKVQEMSDHKDETTVPGFGV